MPVTFSKNTTQLLAAGLLGSLLTALAEGLFHYVPWAVARQALVNQLFLKTISLDRLEAGYIILFFSIPLYFLGYFGVMRLIQEEAKKESWIFLWAAYTMMLAGVLWIGTRPVFILLLQNGGPLEEFLYFHELAILVARALLFVASIFLVFLFQKTPLSPGIIFMNPFVLWALCFLLFFVLPGIFWPLVLVAFNVAHVGFFGWLLYSSNKKV